MPTSTWMVQRLRSAFLRENTLLIVLRLLRDTGLSEWEILEILHSRYGSVPTAKEFRKLCELMVRGGYAEIEAGEAARRLQITRSGVKLLSRLEDEYQSMLSELAAPSGVFLMR